MPQAENRFRDVLFRCRDFAGGLNDAELTSLSGSEATQIDNFLVTEARFLQKREGYFYHNTTSLGAGGIKGLYIWPRTATASDFLCAHGTDIYKFNSGTGEYASVQSGMNASATEYFFASYGGLCFITNGYDTLRQWNGTAVSATGGGATAGCRYCWAHGDRVWEAATAANPDRAYYCELGDTTTWSVTGFMDIFPGDQGYLRMGESSRENLLAIFKDGGAFSLSGMGPLTWDLKKQPECPGLHSSRSLVRGLRGLCYRGPEGWYLYDNGTAVPLTLPLSVTFGRTTNSVAAAGVWKNRLLISDKATAAASVNNKIWLQHPMVAEPPPWVCAFPDIGASVFAAHRGAGTDDQTYWGDPSIGRVYRWGAAPTQSTDPGSTAITAAYTSPPYDGGDSEPWKIWEEVQVELNASAAGTMTVRLIKDLTSTNYLDLPTVSFVAGRQIVAVRIPDCTSRWLQIKISTSTNLESLCILGTKLKGHIRRI